MNATEDHKRYVRETLLPIYNDPSTGYKGRDALYAHIRPLHHNISRRDVAYFLANLEAHQLHLIRRRDKTIRNIVAARPNRHWQTDLIDVQKLAGTNRGTRYILTTIDVYSKYLWAIPLRDKTQALVRGALQPLLERYRPRVLQSDNGPEFADCVPEDLRAEVHHILSPAYTPQTNGVVERVNATLKRRIYAYMTHNGTRTYIDALPALVQNYNSTRHTFTKHTPADLFEGRARYIARNRARPHQWPLLEPGMRVRISELLNPAWRKNLFVKKHYLPRWTEALYTIKSRSPDGLFYTLEETGRKRYKAQDLQFVDVDKLVETRRHEAPVFDRPRVDREDHDAPDIPVALIAERRARRERAGVNAGLADYLQ